MAYNFVKPPVALEGKTPTEAAGLKITGKNKWLALLGHAKDKQIP